MNDLPDKSKCFNTGYLLKEWFLYEPNELIRLFLAYIDYSVGIVPREVGSAYKMFLLIIKYFN